MSGGGDAPPEEGAKEAKPEGGGPSKIILILLVLNLGASGFGAFKAATAHAAPVAHEAAPEASGNEITGPVVQLDPFVVNLNEATARYVKVTLQLELTGEPAVANLEKGKQLVRDQVLSYLSGLKVADTLGEAAKDHMKEELLKRIIDALGKGNVKRVFFSEFVVQ
ncbi:MAG: flagellar basal body-associated FliL family protein [Deltaproteobacteria bacterium]|nr:flagellar basal body-associated FliL family protein [Deltaproteobacteria bacterium]